MKAPGTALPESAGPRARHPSSSLSGVGNVRVDARHPQASWQAGYSLVILMVAVTVMNVVVAAALPMWSTYMKRQREAELIFRGLQYAEGIRVFQQRFGRLPMRLEELVEVHPRSMRRLWEDPMTGNTDWGLLMPFGVPGHAGLGEAPGGPGAGGPFQTEPGDQQGAPGTSTRPGEPRGPIVGVHSRSTEEGLRTFFGQSRYDRWQFTVALVTPGGVPTGQPGARPGPQPAPGRPGGVGQPGLAPGTQPPMTRLEWIGRPFPPGVEPQQPGLVPGQPPGGNLPGGGLPGGPGRPGQPQRPGDRG